MICVAGVALDAEVRRGGPGSPPLRRCDLCGIGVRPDGSAGCAPLRRCF